MAKFIVFEGGEFAGKTTLLNQVKEQCEKIGLRTLALQAPSKELPLGKKIREACYKDLDFMQGTSPVTRGMMLLGSIRELAEYISQVEYEFDVILCDRWFYTTLVYNDTDPQGNDWPFFEGVISEMQHFLFNNLEFEDVTPEVPDLVVYLRNAKVAYSRRDTRPGNTDFLDCVPFSEYQRREDRYDQMFTTADVPNLLTLDAADVADHLPAVCMALTEMGVLP